MGALRMCLYAVGGCATLSSCLLPDYDGGSWAAGGSHSVGGKTDGTTRSPNTAGAQSGGTSSSATTPGAGGPIGLATGGHDAGAGGAPTSGGTPGSAGAKASGSSDWSSGGAATNGGQTASGGESSTAGVGSTPGGGTAATGGIAGSGGTTTAGGASCNPAAGGAADLPPCTGGHEGACILGSHGTVATRLPTDVSAPVFLWSLPPGALIGYREGFAAGDRIVALGAVTSVLPNESAAEFQIAVYSEVDSVPGLLLTATQDITSVGYDDGCTNNQSVAMTLAVPFEVPTTGSYWIMILVGTAPVTIVANNSSVVLPIRCGNGFIGWPTQAPNLLTTAACLPEGDTNLGVAPRLYAILNRG